MKYKSLFILILLLFSNCLLAHSTLESSMPANGEMLKSSPESVSLAFSKPVKLIKFKLISSEQKAIETDFKASMDERSSFAVKNSELPDGHYTVSWTVMGSDGHKMKGEFQFTVMKMGEMEDHDEHDH